MQRSLVLLSLVVACSGGRGGARTAVQVASCPGLASALDGSSDAMGAVLQTCGSDVPSPLAAWARGEEPSPELAPFWEAACPQLTLDELGNRPDDRDTRRRIAAVCTATPLTSGDIVWGTGRPALALVVGAWARAAQVGGDLPDRLLRAIAGPRALDAPVDLDLPRTEAGIPLTGQFPTVVLTDAALSHGDIRHAITDLDAAPADLGGPWAGHRVRALETPAGPLLAADRSTPMRRVERVLASAGSPGDTLHLATGKAHAIPIQLPTPDAPSARVRLRPDGLDVEIDGKRIAPTVACSNREHTVCHGPQTAAPDTLTSPYDLEGLKSVLKDIEAPVIRLDAMEDTPLQVFVTVASALVEKGSRVELDLSHAPCATPPEGMVCVEGGPARVGSDRGSSEAPEREIELSTYYIDKHEVSVAEYEACRSAGYCRGKPSVAKRYRAALGAADQPVVGLNWEQARRVCSFHGKRLPSEWEWEKAARGSTGSAYPQGDEAPTCDEANTRDCATASCGKRSPWMCPEHATRPVTDGQPGHYGTLGMAGNALEWTQTWGVRSPASDSARASGLDPRGPCDGAPKCWEQGKKVLRGGSWRDPIDASRSSTRTLADPSEAIAVAGVRCATSDAFTASREPSGPTQQLPMPTAAEPELQAYFAGVEEDPLKPICGEEVRSKWVDKLKKGGRSTTECRDVYSYVKPNEPRGHIWRDLIQNRGGAYVGVASDQNYTYAAIARARWIWLMDYDPVVVRLHQVLEPLILAAETPAAFVELWRGAAEPAHAAIRAHFGDDAERYVTFYGLYKNTLAKYYAREAGPHPDGVDDFGWLRNPEQYTYIRTLHQQDRIHAVKGDMLGDVTMVEIGKAARAMGVPVRVYYTSNAPTAWGGQVTPAYRRNVRALPMDEQSIVLQTMNFGAFAQTGYWHHNVQWGLEQQRRLGLENGYRSAMHLVWDRLPGDDGDLTINGLP